MYMLAKSKKLRIELCRFTRDVNVASTSRAMARRIALDSELSA